MFGGWRKSNMATKPRDFGSVCHDYPPEKDVNGIISCKAYWGYFLVFCSLDTTPEGRNLNKIVGKLVRVLARGETEYIEIII